MHVPALATGQGQFALSANSRHCQSTNVFLSICFALIHIGLGNKDQAFVWLEKAYQERSDFLLVLKVDQLFDSLRPNANPPFSEPDLVQQRIDDLRGDSQRCRR